MFFGVGESMHLNALPLAHLGNDRKRAARSRDFSPIALKPEISHSVNEAGRLKCRREGKSYRKDFTEVISAGGKLNKKE